MWAIVPLWLEVQSPVLTTCCGDTILTSPPPFTISLNEQGLLPEFTVRAEVEKVVVFGDGIDQVWIHVDHRLGASHALLDHITNV